MKKKGLLLGILILLKIILPLKPYVELNHLKIINKIEVKCSKSYEITYQEIIPTKEENGIEYEYKTYKVTNNNLLKGIKELEKDQYFYKKEAKIILKNCKKKKEIKSKIKRG